MKPSFLRITIASIFLFTACHHREEPAGAVLEAQNVDSEASDTEKWVNGFYCASVGYSNPNTGTESNYDLTVKVEDGKVTVIYWPNGGWLDESHFTPEEIDDAGVVSFTSDKGYNYEVQLMDKGPCARNNTIYLEDSDEEEAEKEEAELERTHAGQTEGVVVWEHAGCDYIIIEARSWYVVAEKRVGAYRLDIGDRVRGDIIGYGYEDVYDFSSDDEVSLYIDNYYGSKSSALENVMEQCDLNEDDD